MAVLREARSGYPVPAFECPESRLPGRQRGGQRARAEMGDAPILRPLVARKKPLGNEPGLRFKARLERGLDDDARYAEHPSRGLCAV